MVTRLLAIAAICTSAAAAVAMPPAAHARTGEPRVADGYHFARPPIVVFYKHRGYYDKAHFYYGYWIYARFDRALKRIPGYGPGAEFVLQTADVSHSPSTLNARHNCYERSADRGRGLRTRPWNGRRVKLTVFINRPDLPLVTHVRLRRDDRAADDVWAAKHYGARLGCFGK